MRMTITAELDISLGSGGCWYEVEIDFNYTTGGDVEAVTYRVRHPLGRPVNGKWRMTPYQDADATMCDIIERALDRDWLIGEARDLMRAEADDCWEDVA